MDDDYGTINNNDYNSKNNPAFFDAEVPACIDVDIVDTNNNVAHLEFLMH